VSSQPVNTPWDGRPQRADVIILAAIGASALYALILLPLVPSLVGSHPALLEILRGSMTSIVTMGALARTGDASLVVALCAGIPALIAFDWAYWWAGRRWGERGIQMISGRHRRGAKHAARAHRLMERWGPAAVVLAYVLPVPTALVDMAAGWSGMRLAVFIVCDIIGALLWASLLVALGYGLGQSAVDVAHKIAHYSLYLTIAIIVGIVVSQGLRANRSPQSGL
jgi:membrane-associated protein